MRNFEGKTAVVTGAASGIGKALAEKFAQEKMQVVLADIEEEALEKSVDNLRQYQHRVIGIKTDVLILSKRVLCSTAYKREGGSR